MNKMQWLVTALALALGTATAATPPTGPATATATTAPQSPAATAPAPSAAPTPAEVAAWTSSCKIPGERDPFHVVLDGKAATRGQRQAVLSKLDECAQNGSVASQNFIGALYWMGEALPDSLVLRDPQKALTYLSNAAAHGDIQDMAKLAEIELAQGHTEAAMIWAQLYGHYLPLRPGRPAVHHSYLAELVARIDTNFDPKNMPAAIAHADAFVARYDVDIRAYRAHWKHRGPHHTHDLRIRSRGRLPAPMQLSSSGQRPYSGFADYLVGVDPAGKVDHTWLLDAYPIRSTGRQLRPVAMSTRFSTSGKADPRYAILPVVYNDLRYYAVRQHG